MASVYLDRAKTTTKRIRQFIQPITSPILPVMKSAFTSLSLVASWRVARRTRKGGKQLLTSIAGEKNSLPLVRQAHSSLVIFHSQAKVWNRTADHRKKLPRCISVRQMEREGGRELRTGRDIHPNCLRFAGRRDNEPNVPH
jgi:hypothetical protein